MTPTTIAYIPSSHLDLFWLGSYRTCLDRGAQLIRAYLDRCLTSTEETFFIETVVFADYFLQRHPEYREPLLRLIAEGRVEIGTVWVDRWEHLILGESHIRNVQIGAAWSEAFLGRANPVATHPDLPGLVAQTSQIYTQANVRYYVTSRKVFPEGAVWHHRAPDGSELTFLSWPKHYMYYPVQQGDLPREQAWIASGIDIPASLQGFPLGTIPITANAGDLTVPDDFITRYGASLESLVAANRAKYPELTFTYTIPSTFLAPYDNRGALPLVEGEIPSVWGVACDETVQFFQRNRQCEYQLLTAETLAVVLDHLTLPTLPPTETPWQGHFYESAFFAPKDPIPAGEEFAALWKMHIFTEDHNGGGYEAALSTFQKQQMQGRVLDYTGQIIAHGLRTLGTGIASPQPGIIAFNPLGQPWNGHLRVAIPTAVWESGLRAVDANGHALPQQMVTTIDGTTEVAVSADLPSVGYAFIPMAAPTLEGSISPITAEMDDASVTLTSDQFSLTIDRATGGIISLHDRERHIDWGRAQLGAIRAVRETGNDVTLRTDETIAVESTLRSVTLENSGPLFSSIRIERELLGNTIDQHLSLWHDGHAELEVRVRWSGAHNWQLRLALPTSDTTDDIAYGSPFHGSGWTDITAECAPRNGDEVLPEDYHRYREVQEWIHVRSRDAGLLQVTTHPGFCFVDRGLEAVLLRSSPSCGDTRFFWENAGEQVYRFAWYPTGADWKEAHAISRAQHTLRPPVTAWVEASEGQETLPPRMSFLRVEPPSAVLTSLSRNVESDDTDIRVLAATGRDEAVTLTGPLIADVRMDAVNLRGETIATGDMPFALPAWRIQTFTIRS